MACLLGCCAFLDLRNGKVVLEGMQVILDLISTGTRKTWAACAGAAEHSLLLGFDGHKALFSPKQGMGSADLPVSWAAKLGSPILRH